MTHIPVLLQEVVDGLAPRAGETILDCTAGGGGHSEALCLAAGEAGRVICLDADEDAIARSKDRLAKCSCGALFYQTNFRFLDRALAALGVATVHRILFDLGFSSFQLEESGRGFSFQRDEPLAMTFQKESRGITAERIVNEWGEESIATVIASYGEERRAARIAAAIVAARGVKPIGTTGELVRIIEGAAPRQGKTHPATKTFQALRIAVNDEFQALTEALPKAFLHLARGGRMAVISFHSMEDRAVKRFFREEAGQKQGILITKKPIIAGDAEREANPRSRSAKLRIIEKV